MKRKNDISTSQEHRESNIPPLDIIDLDSGEDIDASSARPTTAKQPATDTASKNDPDAEASLEEDFSDDEENEEDSDDESPSFLDKLPPWVSRINFHIVFLVVAVLLIIGIFWGFSNWGVLIHQDDIFSDGKGSYDNSYDMMLPAFDENGDPIYPKYDKDTQIVFFGNNPFSDDRDSKNNLVNIIQKETGATVYNCSISGSLLASAKYALRPYETPMDAFNLYWLAFLPLGDSVDKYYLDSVNALGDQAPPEAMEVYNTLKSIDFSQVDVVCIMYDGSDYLNGSPMYNDNVFNDPITFTGNLAASVEVLRNTYPHIRFIVMSPTYAYGLEEDGTYISSDIQIYGNQHYLSTYVIKQAEACSAMGVTFVDNLYGTVHEDNADQYLSDHLHLNVDGRKKVAQRFLDAYYYYNDRE